MMSSRAQPKVAIMTALIVIAGAISVPACYAHEALTLLAHITPIAKTGTAEVRTVIQIGTNTPGELPSPVVGMVTRMPSEMYLAASSLGVSICKPETFTAHGPAACPRSSILGYGRAKTETLIGGEVVVEHAIVTSIMGTPIDRHTRLLDFAAGYSPVSGESISTSTIAERTGPSGSELSTAIPLVPSLPEVAPASLVSLEFTIDPSNLRYYHWHHGKRVSYRPRGISLPERCPAGGYHFSVSLTFLDKSTVTAPSIVPCSETSRPKRRVHART
jgi:hypothetical protein